MEALFKREPGLFVALAVAALHAGVLLGLHLTSDQQLAIVDVLKEAATIAGELGGAALIARSQTVPAAAARVAE